MNLKKRIEALEEYIQDSEPAQPMAWVFVEEGETEEEARQRHLLSPDGHLGIALFMHTIDGRKQPD